MGHIPLLAWLLQGLPESIVLVFFSCKILGVRLATKGLTVIGFGILQGIAAYFLRMLSLAYGVHTILLTVILSIWTYLIVKSKYYTSLISASLAMLVLVIFEVIVFNIIDWAGFDLAIIRENIWLWIAAGWLQIIALLLTAVIVEEVFNAKKIKIFLEN